MLWSIEAPNLRARSPRLVGSSVVCNTQSLLLPCRFSPSPPNRKAWRRPAVPVFLSNCWRFEFGISAVAAFLIRGRRIRFCFLFRLINLVPILDTGHGYTSHKDCNKFRRVCSRRELLV